MYVCVCMCVCCVLLCCVVVQSRGARPSLTRMRTSTASGSGALSRLGDCRTETDVDTPLSNTDQARRPTNCTCMQHSVILLHCLYTDSATSTRRLCSYMCLSVCMSVNRITHKLLINLCEILWNCWTRCRNQLIRIWIRIQEFLKEFNHCNIGNCKGCSSWVGNSPKMHRLADLRLNKLKAVCTLRGVSVVIEAEALIIII